MAPHSSTLAWKIPWTEEPGRLQSMGSLRVRHDLVTEQQPLTQNCLNHRQRLTQNLFPVPENIMIVEVWKQRRKHSAAAKSLQSCPTLCDPIDGSSPGSPVPGILQTRTLEWVAISFSNA